MHLSIVLTLALSWVLYGESGAPGNVPISAVFSQWLQLLQEGKQNTLQEVAQQLEKLNKETLMQHHSNALHDLPPQVDEFLYELSNEAPTNMEDRLQIIHATLCRDYKNSLCYSPLRTLDKDLGSWRNKMQVVIRVPAFLTSRKLFLFALEWDEYTREVRKTLVSSFTSVSSNSTIIQLQGCSMGTFESNSFTEPIQWRNVKGFVMECPACSFSEFIWREIEEFADSLKPITEGEMILMTSPCMVGRPRKRSMESGLIDACDSGRESRQPCCVEHYNFYQNESRIGPLFVRPVVLNMNICRGYCSEISTSVTQRAAFINAIHTSISPKLREFLLNQECCSPVQYKPLTVLYYDEHSKLQTKQLQNFTATRCGCH